MRVFCVSLALLVSSSMCALANGGPMVWCCTVSLDETGRLLMIPDENGNPLAEFYVIVRNMYTCCTCPVPNAVVEVLINGQYDGRTQICAGTELTKVSGPDGYVEFQVLGGGCVKGPCAIVIRVNGVEIRTYEAVVSPDYAGWDNAGMPYRSSLSVTPEDLAAFAAAYRGGTGGPSCHDYNNNDAMDPTDLAVFTSAYRGGTAACPP